MKKLIPLSLMCLLLVGVSNIQAQTAENPWGVTFRTGFASYNGDLGNTMLELTNREENQEKNETFGIGISYFINDSWGISLNANLLPLEKANGPDDDIFAQRNTSYGANVVNLNVLLRWNFLNTFVAERNSNFNTFVTLGLAGNHINHSSSHNKGDVISPNDNSELFFSVPFGGGMSYAVSDDIILNLQLLYNRTFTDNIDLFPSSSGDTKGGVSAPDLDGIDHDDFLMTTIGVTFAFGGPDKEEVNPNAEVLESLHKIESDVDDINNKMDEVIDLNEQTLDALEELKEAQNMSDQQMQDMRAKFVRIVNNIQFAFDKAEIIEPAYDELESLADVMKEYQNLGLNIAAFADERGSVEYNNDLAQQRAQSVKDFLTAQGVSASRISTNVYGETESVFQSTEADNQTVWAQNRAVQITLSYNGM